jgi:hypothetical protein
MLIGVRTGKRSGFERIVVIAAISENSFGRGRGRGWSVVVYRAVGLKVSVDMEEGKIVGLKYFGRLKAGSLSSRFLVTVFAFDAFVARFFTDVADMGTSTGRSAERAHSIIPSITSFPFP